METPKLKKKEKKRKEKLKRVQTEYKHELISSKSGSVFQIRFSPTAAS